MVKLFTILALVFSISLAQEVVDENPLKTKIQSFIDESVYNKNKAYINIIFSPKEDYFVDERVDSVKVIETLKENGLLKLFFKKPNELTLRFKTNGSPLFFVKIMGDTLRSIGYYKYVTKESNLNELEFIWTIVLTSEYATDPLVLQQELAKSGCLITDIKRDKATDWTYTIDMRDAALNVQTMSDKEVRLKRSLYAKWIDISEIKRLTIRSSRRNSWYPYIAYYNKKMNLLKVLKKDERRRKIILNLSDNTHYIKISDIYTLKNIRDDLTLTPSGTR